LLYVHEDLRGTTTFYSKQGGQVFEELNFDAWGFPISPNKLINNDRGSYITASFTGHKFDVVLNIYFAQARFYDAPNRHWISRDPIKDGLNWYVYVACNPKSFVDPTGLYFMKVKDGAFNFMNNTGDYSRRPPWMQGVFPLFAPDPLSYVLYDPNMFSVLSLKPLKVPFSIEHYAKSAASMLTDIYGSRTNIISTDGWTGNGFVDWWNNLPRNTHAIVIYGHGTPFVQGVDESIRKPIRISHVSELQQKNVNMLILMGCNTGHLDVKENIASAFTSKVASDGVVVAIDGSLIYNIELLGPHHRVTTSKSFIEIKNEEDALPRTNQGFVAYYRDGSREENSATSRLGPIEILLPRIYESYVR